MQSNPKRVLITHGVKSFLPCHEISHPSNKMSTTYQIGTYVPIYLGRKKRACLKLVAQLCRQDFDASQNRDLFSIKFSITAIPKTTFPCNTFPRMTFPQNPPI
jgi:hypothetical protein